MKLHRLKLRGLATPWRDKEAVVDFDQAGPGIIAIVGDNGAGKSTLLEASGPAVLFREFPSYGEPFAAHVAPGVRDAHAELTFTATPPGGKPRRFRALVQADPQFGGGRGKTEAYLWDDLTGEKLAGPLVKDYDAAIAALLPPAELFYASAFACQGGGGSFFGMPKAARKDLFVRMLGLEHLQALSEQARQRAQATATELEAARQEMDRIEPRLARARELTEQAARIGETLKDLEAAAAARKIDLDAAQARLADAERAHAEAVSRTHELEMARQGAQARLQAATEALAKATARGGRLRTLLEGAAEIQGAVESLAAREPESREREKEIEAMKADIRLQEIDLARQEQALDLLRQRRGQIQEKLAAAEGASEQAGEAGRMEQALNEQERADAELAAQVEAAHGRYQAAETAATEARAHSFARSALEIEGHGLANQTGLLAQIDIAIPMCGACPLTQDAQKAAGRLDAIEADLATLPEPELLPEGEGEGGSRLQADHARNEALKQYHYAVERGKESTAMVAKSREALAGLAGHRASAAELPAIQAEMADNTSEGREARGHRDAAEQRLKARLTDLAERVLRIEGDRLIMESLKAMASRAAEMRAAAEEQATVEVELAGAEADMVAATTVLGGLPEAAAMEPLVAARDCAVADAEHAVGHRDMAVEGLENQRRKMAGIEGELAGLGSPESEAIILGDRQVELHEQHTSWALLERGLGRDGVQALEVDAAGPGVTAIANDLLATCYGPRFQIAIETTAAKKDGGTREVFDIRILDAEAGREARQGSGGEQVIMDEALRLALSIYNAQRSGHQVATLWRDETAGALSPKNADRYVAMLRRAATIGGFEQVLFIAHQEDVWRQADARIALADGDITIE